jgi:hypothetical protein
MNKYLLEKQILITSRDHSSTDVEVDDELNTIRVNTQFTEIINHNLSSLKLKVTKRNDYSMEGFCNQ